MSFKINNNIAKLIQLQRTWAAKISQEDMGFKFWESCQKDFDIISPFLNPTDCLLDIGCGLAGTDLIILRDMSVRSIDLFDLDRVDSRVRYGYTKTPSAYNTRDAVVDFYALNGVTMPPYHTTYPVHLRFDVIISLISYGFHYPVQTYINEVVKTLNPGGRVILDIRRGTCQEKGMSRHFKSRKVIQEAKSYRRIVFEGLGV